MEEPYSWSFTTDHGAVIQSPLPPQVRKYYFLGGQRVAQRQIDEFGEDVVYWLAGDHLGTTSLVLCGTPGGCDGVAEGEVVAESRHYPYGVERWSSGTLPTDYKFTGQRDAGLGLYHMGARFYDSALSRWLSADTLVPEPGNPQSLNRYSYVGNSPLRFVDPTGHHDVPAAVATWEWAAAGGGAGALSVCAAELSVAAPVVGGVVGVAAIGVGGYVGTVWVLNCPLGPDYPMPEESVPGGIGATYPLPEGSTLTLMTGQASTTGESKALGLEIPSLEIPDLAASTETYGLELPTVHETGKNTPVGRPWEQRPRHRSDPLPKIQDIRPELPPPPGPPEPPEDWAGLAAWVMYYVARLALQADKALPDVLPFE